MASPQTPLSLRLDADVRARLQHVAEADDRSLSYVAQKAIVAFLDARQSREQAIAAAMKEADAGVFISDEAMTDWVNSWDSGQELPAPVADEKIKSR